LVYSRKLEKNYSKWHHHYLLTNGITDGIFGDYISNSSKKIPMDKKDYVSDMLYSSMEIVVE
jgi:hypothetical protein